MSSNLTLFLTVYFHAVHGYAAIHMYTPHVYASLPFCHCYEVASCSSYLDMPFPDSINRFSKSMYCTYDMIVYKNQGIDWHPQSDSLGVFL